MRYRVQINYKSGQSMVIECDDFSVSTESGVKTYAWEGAKPTPILLGADSIESVWTLDAISDEEKD